MAASQPAEVVPTDTCGLCNGGLKTRNLVGRKIQKLRVAKHWSQKKLAEKLQLAGLDKSREAVGRIEARLVYVRDYELLYIAKALGVDWLELLPDINPNGELRDVIAELMKPRKSTAPRWRRRKAKKAKKTRPISRGQS